MKKFPLVLHETAIAWRNLLDLRLKPLGLSQAKWRTLLYLSLARKPLTQTELAHQMGIEGATVVGLIDRLEKEGWVDRRIQLDDRRVRNIHLTQKSELALEKIHAIADQLGKQLLTKIPKNSLKICVQVLEDIKQQMCVIKPT